MSHVTFKGNLRNELHDAKQKQTIITDGPKSHGSFPTRRSSDLPNGNVRQRERLPDRTHRRPFPYAQIPR